MARTRPLFCNVRVDPGRGDKERRTHFARRSISGSGARKDAANLFVGPGCSWCRGGESKNKDEVNDTKDEQAVGERNVHEQPGFQYALQRIMKIEAAFLAK
jgi:hypothetical protein